MFGLGEEGEFVAVFRRLIMEKIFNIQCSILGKL
jgi:hypothetical protein